MWLSKNLWKLLICVLFINIAFINPLKTYAALDVREIKITTTTEKISYNKDIEVIISVATGTDKPSEVKVYRQDKLKKYTASDLTSTSSNLAGCDSYKLVIHGIGGTKNERTAELKIECGSKVATKIYKVSFAPLASCDRYGIYADTYNSNAEVYIGAPSLGREDITRVTSGDMKVYLTLPSECELTEVTVTPSSGTASLETKIYEFISVTKFPLNRTSSVKINYKYKARINGNEFNGTPIEVDLSKLYDASWYDERIVINNDVQANTATAFICGKNINTLNFKSVPAGYMLLSYSTRIMNTGELDVNTASKVHYVNAGRYKEILLMRKVAGNISKVALKGIVAASEGNPNDTYEANYEYIPRFDAEVAKTDGSENITVKMVGQNGLNLATYDGTTDGSVKFTFNYNPPGTAKFVKSIYVYADNVEIQKFLPPGDTRTLNWTSDAQLIKNKTTMKVTVYIDGANGGPLKTFEFPIKKNYSVTLNPAGNNTTIDSDTGTITANFKLPPGTNPNAAYIHWEGVGIINQDDIPLSILDMQYTNYNSTTGIGTYRYALGGRHANGSVMNVTVKIFVMNAAGTEKEEKASVTGTYNVVKNISQESLNLGEYGNPDDLTKLLDPKYNNSVAGIIVTYAKTIAAILLYVSIVMLGINVIMNRGKAEERTNSMTGFMYICIGVIIFSSVIILYSWLSGIVNSTDVGNIGETVTTNPVEANVAAGANADEANNAAALGPMAMAQAAVSENTP